MIQVQDLIYLLSKFDPESQVNFTTFITIENDVQQITPEMESFGFCSVYEEVCKEHCKEKQVFIVVNDLAESLLELQGKYLKALKKKD